MLRCVLSSVVGLLLALTGPVGHVDASGAVAADQRATAADAAQAATAVTVAGGPIRISGTNRYATAAGVAASWPEETDTAFVVSGSQFPDALAAAARAGVHDAPLLLTRQDTIPPETESALRRLRPQRVVVVGGESAVSTTVLNRLKLHASSGQVLRLAGTDRYDTAAAVSRLYPAQPQTAYLASGQTFPDALAGAALAGHRQAPLLLTRPDGLDASTRAELARLAPRQVIVLGGRSAVSDVVVREAARVSGAPVRRISGTDRYETAAAVAQEYPSRTTPAYVASGQDFPDALVGAAAASHAGVPLVLTPADRVHPGTARALRHQQPTQMYVLGGTRVVHASTLQALGAYLSTPKGPEIFTPLSETTTFSWSGQTWSAKEARLAGPGPNRWHRSGVELGDQGSMRLRVKQNASGQWQSAEVLRAGQTGYGTFSFSTTSSVVPANDVSVLGMFTYQSQSPQEGNEEIDIEYARWGRAGTGPGSVGTHKPDPPWVREFPVDYTGPMTHTFLWAPGYIRWRITRVDTGAVLYEQKLWGAAVPTYVDARMRLNLWLMDGMGPDTGEPFAVTFSSARWTPLPAGFTPPPDPGTPPTTSLTDTFDEPLDTARWPGSQRYGRPDVFEGRLVLPLGPGYHGVQSSAAYALADSSISVEQVRPRSVHGESESEVAFVRDEAHSVHVFAVGSGTGRVRIRTGGVNREWDFAYDPVTYRWVRMRHTGSQLRFEGSPDGHTWSALVPAQTAPAWIDGAIGQVKLGGGNWQTTDPAGTVGFDNLNLAP